jgi:hypothetical protein
MPGQRSAPGGTSASAPARARTSRS